MKRRVKKFTEEELRKGLPHGGGIDADWNIEDKGKYFLCKCSFHCMDGYGSYDGWSNFSVVIPKSDPTNFSLHFHGKRGQYLATKHGLREYLEDTLGEELFTYNEALFFN